MLLRALLIALVLVLTGCQSTSTNQPPKVEYVP